MNAASKAPGRYLEGSDLLDLGLRKAGPNCEEQLGQAVSGNVVAEINEVELRPFVWLFQFCGAFSAGIALRSISTQHTLEKADVLGDYVDRLFCRHRLGDWCAGINRFWWIESNTWCPRLTAAMISSGLAVQVKAFDC